MDDLSALDIAAIVARSADPFWFFTNVLGWLPTPAARNYGYTEGITPDQRRVVESVRAHRHTFVPAGVGVGKTRVAAGLVHWFLFTHPHSKVITTAPTAFQVENLLWREIRACHAAARVPLGGRLLQTQLELDIDWFAIGLSPAVGQEQETATRAGGFHAPAILVIGDEATGIHPAVIEALEGVAVGPQDRILYIGNPTDPTSRFKALCESGRGTVIELSGMTHPNVIHDDAAIIPGAVSRAWIEAKLADYGGPESPLARAKIFGKWPAQGEDTLISLAWVEAAVARYDAAQCSGPARAGGCDVARFGSDDTVIAQVWGDPAATLTLGPLAAHRGWNTMATAGALAALALPTVAIDDTGVGGGVTDRLNELQIPCVPVNFGETATDPTKWVNRRAELYWTIRERLRLGTLNLPPDDRLKGELTNLKYKYDSDSRIVLEPKAAIKARSGRSPDKADGAVLAVWVAVTGGCPTGWLAYLQAATAKPANGQAKTGVAA